MNQCFTLLFQK